MNGQLDCYDQYVRDGYCILNDFLRPSDILTLSQHYDEAVRSSLAGELEGLVSVTCSALHWVKNPSLVLGGLIDGHAISLNARAEAARLLEADPSNVKVSPRIFLKPAGAAETRWHQEAAFFGDSGVKRLNIWVPLDGATECSGCMKFVPGSHRGLLLQHVVDGNEESGRTLFIPEMHEPYHVVPMQIGQASAHHYLTVHGATANLTGKNRRALVLVCLVSSGGIN